MNTSIIWEILKLCLIPLAIWYFEHQIQLRDEKRDREYRARKAEQQKAQDQNDDIQYLMMLRLDKVSDMTHLMAQKLHDKGVINGDLEKLDQKYQELDAEYEDEVKRLALIMKRKRGS